MVDERRSMNLSVSGSMEMDIDVESGKHVLKVSFRGRMLKARGRDTADSSAFPVAYTASSKTFQRSSLVFQIQRLP